jgi:hypothetical protein
MRVTFSTRRPFSRTSGITNHASGIADTRLLWSSQKPTKTAWSLKGLSNFEFINPSEAEVGKELTATIKASKASSRFVLLEVKLASAQGLGKTSGISS